MRARERAGDFVVALEERRYAVDGASTHQRFSDHEHAGVFRITARDAFGNACNLTDEKIPSQFRIWAQPPTSSGWQGVPSLLRARRHDTQQKAASNVWAVDAGKITRAGVHALEVSLVSCTNGLAATYYDHENLTGTFAVSWALVCCCAASPTSARARLT